MKKSELKNGAVVELRNGERYLKVDNTLLDIKDLGMYIMLDKYKEDLTHPNGKKWDIMKVNNNVDNGLGYCNNALYQALYSGKWTWERKEEILDEVEKEYLSAVIKPFRGKIRFILKQLSPLKNMYYITFELNDECFPLPYFSRTSQMYKGMELSKKYTLKDLGLK